MNIQIFGLIQSGPYRIGYQPLSEPDAEKELDVDPITEIVAASIRLGFYFIFCLFRNGKHIRGFLFSAEH